MQNSRGCWVKNTFKQPSDFRRSLENRLHRISIEQNRDLERLRRQVAFDRLLARICHPTDPTFILKGGYAMELRMATARATKDIDLTCSLNSLLLNEEMILEEIRSRARANLEDYFSYEIGIACQDLDGPPYGGQRYPVTSFLNGRIFVRFRLDVGIDVLADEIEMIQATDWLSSCGINAPVIPMVSVEQQLAEKIHAYSRPRSQCENTRVKDLIDFLLIIRYREISFDRLSKSLNKIFRVHNTHPLPVDLNSPPVAWEYSFSSLANECGIDDSLEQAYQKLAVAYKKVLAV